MNVVLYIRVSSNRQVEEGHSIEGQLQDLHNFCSRNEHVIVKEYIESGNSAYKGERPVFNQMLAEVTSNVFDVEAVIVYSLSRFARDLLYQLASIKKLEDSGIKLISATEPLPEDAMTFKSLTVVLGLVNEMNSRQNAINVKARLTQTAEAGYFTGGPVPFGYESVACDPSKKNSRKKLVICEKEAEIVRKIFELSLNGTGGKGLGVKAIAKYLNDRAITNRGSKWSINAVHRLLCSTTYFGEFVFGKTRKDKSLPQVVVPIPPIIDKELFNSVKMGLKSRDVEQIHVKAIRSSSLLTGLIKCGKCGRGMTVATGKSGKYKYYACATKLKNGVSLCSSKWVSKSSLELIVEEAILERLINKDYILEIIDEIKSVLASRHTQSDSELLKLCRKLKLVQQKLENSYEQIAAKENLMDDSYAEYLTGLQKQRSELQEQIELIKSQGRLPIRTFGEKQIDVFVKVMRQLIKEQNDESKKILYFGLIQEVKVFPESVTLKGSKLGLLAMVSKTKEGTSNLVPSFISKWRSGRDSNPRPPA
ncbi:recombinase family protein [Photobacterium swingsii]|uniref:recombinase family protein n=1 Tax=Photobacterium swingsii TaxID=680026 RepID=UPI0040676D13